MRPLRLEMEGFSSFRDATSVELADADLFVLSGPTGAGKSSIIDAIVFALYGSVPRYDDRRLVAPIVNQGRNEARVRLTFAVAERTYQATRVVRRTATGATTKEARLEDVTDGGIATVAGTADELSTAIGRLLGLTFEQFTRSVVLPQGDFDRFLFAKPRERNDLLVQLLDLGVYEEIGKRARLRATQAEARITELRRRLDGELAEATPEARDEAAARLQHLRELTSRCEELQPELERIVEEGRRRRQEADDARQAAEALSQLAMPDGAAELGDRLRQAAELGTTAERALADAITAVEAAEHALENVPPLEVATELSRVLEELTAAADRARALHATAEAAATTAGEAAAAEEAAVAAVSDARAAVEDATRGELALTLAAHLQVGSPCPVCLAEVADLPQHPPAERTEAARAALTAAEQVAAQAGRTRSQADRERAVAEQAVRAHDERTGQLTDRRDALASQLQVAPDPDEVAALLGRIRAGQQALTDARAHERRARHDVQQATRAADELRDREREAWAAFDRARDAVAALRPPAADRDDLTRAWRELLTWARDQVPRAQERAELALAEVDRAKQRWREVDGRLREECAGAGVEVPAGSTPALAVSGASARAEERLKTLEDRLARAGQARLDLAAARDEQAVAKALGDHLRANGFERWLLNRALTLLVVGASHLMRDLSSGGYSLALDDANQFLVLDHRNADEPRTVRSLSGGERFLASLALALALAEHVADLAAEGAARLESLFLDEGFGTLDADTLDVVAAAIEELGSRGRMVGIVTHVADLAERLPVRFEVRRGPSGSVVTRHDGGATAGAESDAEDAA
ncbi:AAA family ATPase [Egicoccus sp. AB-alg6-2]|uniref:AAA family ATPase n=1 Tax=Egicoccus sp. AB-alg6-2 TaxID=3242692 RepID=UPI00359E0DCB